jgi:hypothetical protein
MTRRELEDRRAYLARRRRDRRLRSEEDAVAFISEVGFCFVFSAEGSPLPTLWDAIAGSATHSSGYSDRAAGLAWEWKDSLPIARRCFYGRLLRNRPVLLSLEMFPSFYAVSGNYGDPDQYQEDYADGKLSYAAYRIYDTLFHEGPLPTSILRRKAGIAGKERAGEFDRAIVELQRGMKIAKVGISDANAWRYCYVYDILPRWLPDLVAQGVAIPTRTAQQAIVAQFIRTVVATTPGEIAWHLGWTVADVQMAVAALVDAGKVLSGQTISGLEGEWLVDASVATP